MRHDFGFLRAGAARLQRRALARERLERHRRDRFTRRLAIAAGAFALAAVPGRLLFAWAFPS